MELIQFIFSGPATFFGTVLLLGMIIVGLIELVAAFKPFAGMITEVHQHESKELDKGIQ